MAATTFPSRAPFVRTRVTWLSYALLACFGFGLSLAGPAMPFLAAKLSLTFTQIGYHFTLMSVGLILFSLFGDKLVDRFGPGPVAWGGALGIGVSLVGFTLGNSAAMTMSSMFLYGSAIAAIFLIANSTIALASGEHAAIAYTEANIIAGLAGILGPILAGLVARSPLGWQAIALLPFASAGLLRLLFWGTPLPHVPNMPRAGNSGATTDGERLPPRFWLFSTLMFLFVSVESLIGVLGASYFATVVGFEMSAAASVMGVFAVALVLGRVIGRRLLESMAESRLMLLALLWVLLAFPLYWLGPNPALKMTGMFLFGLGTGNLSPLALSGAMSAGSAAITRASARFGLFPPLSLLIIIPFFGILSDRFGMQRAYAFMFVVWIAAFAIFAAATRVARVPAPFPTPLPEESTG